jgi:hypothetical protein
MSEDKEIRAMGEIANAISDLDENTRKRIIQWLISREGLTLSGQVLTEPRIAKIFSNSTSIESSQDQSLSEFFYSVDLQNDMERAVAVAYYLQTVDGKEELSSQEINDELKHLGYPISNITKTLNKAMETTPRLMHQTRKEGNARQSRKKYKVTHEGMKFLQAKVSTTTVS